MNANHPLRGAKWIWPNGCPHMRNTYAQFRRDFRLRSVPRKAPFFITADQNYMLYVNGEYVGRGPARGFQRTWAFDEYDLAAHLVRGHNWISVRVFNGGISNFGYLFEWHAGLLCAARWKGFELYSDAKWPSRMSAAYRPDTCRTTVQMNLQEHVDARLDDQAWIRSAAEPKDWPQTSTTRPFGVMPWHAVEPRGIPNLGNEILHYQQTVAAARGRSRDGYAGTPDVGDLLRRELPRLKWTAAAKGKDTADGFSIVVPASGRGKLSAVSVDLGRLGVGNLIVDTRGADGGEIVDLLFHEVNNDNASPVVSGPVVTSRLTLAKGRTRHELYQMMGHRYLCAVVRDSRRPINLRLALRQTVYPFRIKGTFTSSDTTLNGIYDISVRTQRVCSLDSYVDTPWREQAQWWGDARVQIRNTVHLADDVGLLVRGVRCIARQEVPNGLTYSHAPTNCHGCILPDFSIIWAMTLWDYYWQTGEVDLFVEQWPRVERLLGYFTGEGRGRNGLLRYDERYWLFLDWCDIHKKGTPTLLNLWYLLMLDKLATLADLAKMPDEARRLRRLHAEQKRLVLAKLWDARAGMFRDGLTPEGRPVRVCSIQNQTLAILCGLRPEAWPGMVEKLLLPYLDGRKIVGARPSSYWVTYVYSVMTDLGYGRNVAAHIRRMFGPMIPYGGTWETFEFTLGKGSTSHAWSAHSVYHLPGTVGGLRQAEPAWKRVIFAPVTDLPGVDHAATTVPTPHGLIRAQWQRGGTGLDVRLSLPRGVTADVQLPGMVAKIIKGRQRWTLPGR